MWKGGCGFESRSHGVNGLCCVSGLGYPEIRCGKVRGDTRESPGGTSAESWRGRRSCCMRH